jgi:UDP-glucose 4-epimerase
MKRILVTGGCGYIGSHVVKRLKSSGYEPVILDNFSRGNKYIGEILDIPVIEGSIGEKKILNQIFKKFDISCVFHLSAFAYVGESSKNPLLYYNNNLINTIHLLDAMIEFGIKDFVFSSTCSTYGNVTKTPITEDVKQHPINPYAKTKFMIEQILEDFSLAYGLNFISLRYFNAAGADPDAEIGEDHKPETHLIPVLLEVASGKRDEFHLFGDDYKTKDGTCIRDYIHVMDIANAHILSMKYLENDGESQFINLGNGQGYSNLEVVEAVKNVTGKDIKIKYMPRRDGDPDSLVGSAKKANHILGWHPEFDDINEIIRHAWNWHKKKERFR